MRAAVIAALLSTLIGSATAPGQTLAEGDSSARAVNGTPASPGAVFRDCPACPEMVVIPAGRFTMGSSPEEKQWAATHGGNLASVADEAPQHVVTLRPFALGRYPVTRGEYAIFVRETGHSAGDGCGRDSFKWNKEADLNWRNPGFDQSDRDPAVCVSWQDAQAYIGWLNDKLRGQSPARGIYRLPSESEWEYAARAGSTTYFWWGDDGSKAPAFAWSKANSGGHTHPVGLKPMNSFGLYDVVGNVWQWTDDCYAESYAGAPENGDPIRAAQTVSALTGAGPGSIRSGCFARRLAKGIQSTTGMSSWDCAWSKSCPHRNPAQRAERQAVLAQP